MEFDYVLLENFFTDLMMSDKFRPATNGLKVILILGVLTSWGYQIINNYSKFGSDQNKFPLTFKSVSKMAGIIICLGSFDYLLGGLDSLLSVFFSNQEDWDFQNVIPPMVPAEPDSTADVGVWGALKMMANAVMLFLTSPMYLLANMLMFLLWLVEYVVVAFFMGERFFVLLVLKYVGPICLALSTIPRFGGWIWKWLELYIRWYILILPYSLVNWIVKALTTEFQGVSESMLGLDIMMNGFAAMTLLPVFAVLLILKLKLYAAGKQLLRDLVVIGQPSEED